MTVLMLSSYLMPVSAQKAQFTGKIIGLNKNSHVNLLDVAHPNDLVPIQVGADGSFRFELDADEPLTRYVYIDNPKSGFKFYAEKGMKADMQVELKKDVMQGQEYTRCDVTYTGDYKDAFDFLTEGEFFEHAQNPVLQKYMGKANSFGEFREYFRYKLDQLEGKLMIIKNPVFRKWMKDDYEQKFRRALGWYTECGSRADSTLTAWMETLDRNGNADEAATYISFYKKFMVPEGQDQSLTLFKNINSLINNQQIVSSIADSEIEEVIKNAPENITQVFEAYRALNPNRTVPANIQALYDHYKNLVPSAKAADFDMYDMKGKRVMLSDLKGKAVYIDCWATWCGPCKMETPHMAKLYEHYKNNKKIMLVSISLDAKTKPWMAMLNKDKPGWPQYIVKNDFNSTLCTNYNIDAIPRFMMFDSEGRIVSLNAPRPSNPDIISWIDSHLK